MSIEAAYHEAGHVVAAYNSAFHNVGPGWINIGSYGSGAADIMLSRRKAVAAGKPADASIVTHPEVATSYATALAAGLAAERIAASKYQPFVVDPLCSSFDHAEIVTHAQDAGISPVVQTYEASATEVLLENWDAVELVAQTLLQLGGIAGGGAAALLDDHYAKR